MTDEKNTYIDDEVLKEVAGDVKNDKKEDDSEEYEDVCFYLPQA